MKILIYPFSYKGETRIKVVLPTFLPQIQKVNGAKWSNTEHCWHIPYIKDAWLNFKEVFQGFEIQQGQEGLEMRIKTEVKAEVTIEEEIPKEITQTATKTKAFVEVSKHTQKSNVLNLKLPSNYQNYLEKVKNIHGRRFNMETKLWEIPYTQLSIRFLTAHFSGELVYLFTLDTNIPEGNRMYKKMQEEEKNNFLPAKYEEEVTKMEEQMRLRRMSYKTVKTYKNTFRYFLKYYDSVLPSEITEQQIRDYLGVRIKEGISESYQNQIINAIKFYYEQVLRQEKKTYALPRPIQPEKLPNVLSQEEVGKLLNAIDNPKHKCMIMLIYSAGLRLSELINLRIADIQVSRMEIFVKGGKGKKDRITILSEKILSLIKSYIELYHPVDFLFEGIYGGIYSARSVQAVFTEAKEKSGINPYATVHTLRHSFATHLLEAGISLTVIQQLLGHHSIKTTEIYTHITNNLRKQVKSPLDSLVFL
ncbi:MAG: tyrosine-type recombinase/integrase [Bacteroidia bacterium]